MDIQLNALQTLLISVCFVSGTGQLHDILIKALKIVYMPQTMLPTHFAPLTY
jgi:hypothetical protein